MKHTIRLYGDPVLRLKAREVEAFDRPLKDLLEEMFQIMDAADGVGLAAPQIGISKRIFVVDIRKGPEYRFAAVNPVLALSGRKETSGEGCLSIPGAYGEVSRSSQAQLTAFDAEGKRFQMQATGLLARVFQHEVDHLDGMFYVDRLSAVRRALLKSKLKRLEREYAEGRAVEVPSGETQSTKSEV